MDTTNDGWGDDPWGITLQSDPGGFVPSLTDSVNANSSSVATQPVVAGGGQDQWGGMFAALLGKGTDYLIAKDAKQSGIAITSTPNGTAYRPTAGALSNGTILLLGLAVFVLPKLLKG